MDVLSCGWFISCFFSPSFFLLFFIHSISWHGISFHIFNAINACYSFAHNTVNVWYTFLSIFFWVKDNFLIFIQNAMLLEWALHSLLWITYDHFLGIYKSPSPFGWRWCRYNILSFEFFLPLCLSHSLSGFVHSLDFIFVVLPHDFLFRFNHVVGDIVYCMILFHTSIYA